ncbi:Trep_Strep domain-containing protein [Clostridium sporogenes]|uniref:MptD family putative ECF transporter S component n=1 Tax=Clostridium sp. LCP25S3_F8 TaxID=3438751 RepID=UPI0013D82F4C|nr:Trep_Strep domain-containing protein [Clostridium sporogenes]NFS26330.1 Trep_Strep domain-containing protein [Clostridium sporogenes]
MSVNNKITTKDLINLGIFTIFYFVMFFICGLLAYIPILAVILPFLLGIVGGIPFILLVSKTGKFGIVTLMGLLEGLLCFVVGQSWISIIFGFVFGLIADLIIKSGNYKRFKTIAIGYSVFNEWVIGSMLPMWIMRDTFFKMYRENGGTEQYINTMMKLTSNNMLIVVIILALIGGALGMFLGRAMLKKHFTRARII